MECNKLHRISIYKPCNCFILQFITVFTLAINGPYGPVIQYLYYYYIKLLLYYILNWYCNI